MEPASLIHHAHRIDEVQRQLSRGRVWDTPALSGNKLIMVRWDFSGGIYGGEDLSEGEILNPADESATGSLVWIDGNGSLLAVPAKAFGAVAYICAPKRFVIRGGVSRPLYVVVAHYATLVSGYLGSFPNAFVIEVSAPQSAIVLDFSETPLTTTIGGVVGNNILATNFAPFFNHGAGVASSPNWPPIGSRLDWVFNAWNGNRANPDFIAGAGRNGGQGSTLSVDWGETFEIRFTYTDVIAANNGTPPLARFSQVFASMKCRLGSNSSHLVLIDTANLAQLYEAAQSATVWESSVNFTATVTASNQITVTTKDCTGAAQSIVIMVAISAHGRVTGATVTTAPTQGNTALNIVGGRAGVL